MKINYKYILKNKHRILPLLFRKIYLNPLYKFRFFMARHSLFLTENEKQIYELKNIHKGKRIFILGNGPSLNINDINLLKNEITFAANKIYLLFNNTKWRPTYYCVEDDLVMKQNFKEINNLQSSIKLFPADMLAYSPRIKNGLYYNFIQKRNTSIPLVSNNAMYGIYWGGTVVYSMVQLALYMGASEIFILGVDFTFNIPKNHDEEKKEIISEGEINHFHKDYRKKGEKWNYPNLKMQKKAFKALRDYSDTKNVKIYNATRGGKLDNLVKIKLENLF